MVVDWPVAAMTELSRRGISSVVSCCGHCDATGPTNGSILPGRKGSPRHRKPCCEHWVRLKRAHFPSERSTPSVWQSHPAYLDLIALVAQKVHSLKCLHRSFSIENIFLFHGIVDEVI